MEVMIKDAIKSVKETIDQIKQDKAGWNNRYETLKKPTEIISDVIKQDPLNFEAHYLKAQIMEMLDNFHIAIDLLKKCYNFQPTNTALLEEIKAIEDKKKQRAIKGLDYQFERLEKDPKCVMAMHCLASEYKTIGNFEEALNWELRAIDTEPDNWEHYYHIAWTYKRMDQMDNCIDSFKKALHMFDEPIDPEDPESDMKPNINNYIGEMYDEMEDYATGETYIRLALELAHPEVKKYYYIDLANNLLHQKKYQEALIYYALLKETDTDNHYPRVDATIANCYYELGDKDLAKKYYQQCVKDNPTDDNSLYCLGVIYSEEGELEFAKMAYQMALQANGNNMAAHHNLGMMAFREGDYQQSVDHFLRVIQLDMFNENAYLILHDAYEKLTETEKAEEILIQLFIIQEIKKKPGEEK